MATPLDREKVRELLALTGGDGAWFARLMTTYLDDTRVRLADLRGALAEGSPTRVQRAAHGMKGSSANVGATTIAEVCHRIEAMAGRGDLNGVSEAIAELDAALAAVALDVPTVLAGS